MSYMSEGSPRIMIIIFLVYIIVFVVMSIKCFDFESQQRWHRGGLEVMFSTGKLE